MMQYNMMHVWEPSQIFRAGKDTLTNKMLEQEFNQPGSGQVAITCPASCTPIYDSYYKSDRSVVIVRMTDLHASNLS